MVTGEDNIIGSGFDYKTVEINEESLYSSDLIPGIASTSQRIPYLNIPVTAYNPDIPQPSGAYWEPAAEIKWLRNRNNVTMQENKELRLEIKVYKKIIKNLLKKKS
jgi:hypothetical protein